LLQNKQGTLLQKKVLYYSRSSPAARVVSLEQAALLYYRTTEEGTLLQKKLLKVLYYSRSVPAARVVCLLEQAALLYYRTRYFTTEEATLLQQKRACSASRGPPRTSRAPACCGAALLSGIRQHPSAYVSIRAAYVSLRARACMLRRSSVEQPQVSVLVLLY
jgi:hypothetical protein